MKPYSILLSRIDQLKNGNEIFILKSTALPGVIEMACCREDWTSMVEASILSISPSPGLTHRVDVVTTQGTSPNVLVSKEVYLIKPRLVILVKPNEIEFKGLINKKIFFEDVEEISVQLDTDKIIRFSNVHDSVVFDVFGNPKNFSEKVEIEYQEYTIKDHSVSIPVVLLKEKATSIALTFDNKKPITFKIDADIISKAIFRNKLLSDVRKLKTVLSFLL